MARTSGATNAPLTRAISTATKLMTQLKQANTTYRTTMANRSSTGNTRRGRTGTGGTRGKSRNTAF